MLHKDETVYINTEATGIHLKAVLSRRGITVAELQSQLGLTAPQAIYKWFRGESLPSIDNLVVLSHLLELPINDLLVCDVFTPTRRIVA